MAARESQPRIWSRAVDIPAGVRVQLARLDSYTTWQRIGPDLFRLSVNGNDTPTTYDTTRLDQAANGVGFTEVP
ncbi:hypothetical protein IU449_26950 [Nocardia higoensis]|uniref:Uncharacterized protein n=1 Tax=Nocardia higoensis TaxID=228599 RepID=A0ABS0DM60_9NOCA|nr:hypothetical protein [Nocardia higoensis]MBF6358139.1 hypothetical protein [Nocardia higoensis]